MLSNFKMEKSNPNILLGKLFLSEIQIHIFHLQTKSFAEHKALDDYYSSIGDLIDKVVEAYQGKYKIITDYEFHTLVNYKDSEQVINYLTKLHDEVDNKRISLFSDSDILNTIDEIKSLLKSTLYKLKNLK